MTCPACHQPILGRPTRYCDRAACQEERRALREARRPYGPREAEAERLRLLWSTSGEGEAMIGSD